jgi:dTDP-4-dehydrorhamnose 3,5-epimerase/CDP-3, 6-dideoxy-D-glycero-D-glycero-4-hexulose-5-epimerase
MWQIEPTHLEGARIIHFPHSEDERGTFVKTFHDTSLQAAEIDFVLQESYFSTSKKDVIRGMHFQMPPHHHSKIVFCPLGAILDVIVDLRVGSPTYGHHASQILSADNHKGFYIPKGFAHGFKSLTDGAITYYLVSSEYSKAHDVGIKYSSIGFDWEVQHPIVSDRDRSFPTLKDWRSPFIY